jgi:CTP synthase
MKYVLVTGGVVSGLGKGVTASSIGVVLKACGHRVTSVKIGVYVKHAASEMIHPRLPIESACMQCY